MKEQLTASANDRLYRFLMADDTLRGAIVNCTRMVREMRANHELGVVETLILGHMYIAAALMTASLKGKDRIRIQVQCSGPVGMATVEANVFGEVRGYLKNTNLSETSSGAETRLSDYFGAGFLSVTTWLEEVKKPYTGQIVMEYGSIAQDLANYFTTSEQTPTAVNLSIVFDDQGQVAGAGGVFVQAMPGAREDDLADAESAVASIAGLGNELAYDVQPDTFFLERFKKLNPRLFETSRVEFFCRCSRDQMLAYIGALPAADLREICQNGPFPVEIRCHNCNSLYRFDRQDIAPFVP